MRATKAAFVRRARHAVPLQCCYMSVVSGALSARLNQRAEDGGRFLLLAPGIFGIAFVLNAFRALGADLALAVSVVVLGTIFSEIAAYLVVSRGASE